MLPVPSPRRPSLSHLESVEWRVGEGALFIEMITVGSPRKPNCHHQSASLGSFRAERLWCPLSWGPNNAPCGICRGLTVKFLSERHLMARSKYSGKRPGPSQLHRRWKIDFWQRPTKGNYGGNVKPGDLLEPLELGWRPVRGAAGGTLKPPQMFLLNLLLSSKTQLQINTLPGVNKIGLSFYLITFSGTSCLGSLSSLPSVCLHTLHRWPLHLMALYRWGRVWTGTGECEEPVPNPASSAPDVAAAPHRRVSLHLRAWVPAATAGRNISSLRDQLVSVQCVRPHLKTAWASQISWEDHQSDSASHVCSIDDRFMWTSLKSNYLKLTTGDNFERNEPAECFLLSMNGMNDPASKIWWKKYFKTRAIFVQFYSKHL